MCLQFHWVISTEEEVKAGTRRYWVWFDLWPWAKGHECCMQMMSSGNANMWKFHQGISSINEEVQAGTRNPDIRTEVGNTICPGHFQSGGIKSNLLTVIFLQTTVNNQSTQVVPANGILGENVAILCLNEAGNCHCSFTVTQLNVVALVCIHDWHWSMEDNVIIALVKGDHYTNLILVS